MCLYPSSYISTKHTMLLSDLYWCWCFVFPFTFWTEWVQLLFPVASFNARLSERAAGGIFVFTIQTSEWY